MKWALKFATKGKGAGGGGGPDVGKAYQGSHSVGHNGGAAAAGENGPEGVAVGQGGFRSGSEGELVGEGGGYYEEDGLEPGQERETSSLTPPEDGGIRELGGEESSATYEGEEEAEGVDHNHSSSAPPFTEDADSQADSFRASKTARMKALDDDPEAHLLGETDAEWDESKAGRRDGGNSPSGSPGGDNRFDGEGSHSDHSEAEPHGASNEGCMFCSGARRGSVWADGGGDGFRDVRCHPVILKERRHACARRCRESGLVQALRKPPLQKMCHEVDGLACKLWLAPREFPRGRACSGGSSHRCPSAHRDHLWSSATDLERRAMAHAYADGLDGRSMPPAPPGGSAGVNGISPVDARAATALAARTRLAAGGVAVPDRSGVQRPEPAPVLAPGQAALAAEAALRRGPTPGSHSLPSMVLVPLEALKAHRRVPRSSDRRALVRYRDLPDRSRSFVVFVSHAWMRPHTTPSFAHPDTSSRGGEKYRLIAEAGDRIRAHLPPDVRVLLWIDYSCVDQQDSTRRSKATMRGMREYMRRCDAILTVYPGDAADNGEEFLPNRFVKSCAWAGSYKSLAHYCTRGWCRLEMLLGQTEPLPQDGFMFNFLVPKKKKASGAKASVGDRPHFLYGAHQRPHNGRIDVVPRQSSRWFEEHHPEQGNFTHESDRDAIRAVLAKQTSTMAKRSAAIAARYGTDPRRGGGGGASRGGGGERQLADEGGEYGRPH
ncbi:unnamed protein product [Scytosiphon promiscuus]